MPVENKFWTLYETLKNTGEMKWRNFNCVCTISLNFEIFSRVPMRDCFWCYFSQLFLSSAQLKMLKGLKAEMAWFPMGFLLNSSFFPLSSLLRFLPLISPRSFSPFLRGDLLGFSGNDGNAMATQQYHACVQGTVTLFFAHAQRLTNKTFDKATHRIH